MKYVYYDHICMKNTLEKILSKKEFLSREWEDKPDLEGVFTKDKEYYPKYTNNS